MDSRFSRLLHRITEPQILFPLSALITLILIWGGTWSYIRLLQTDLERRARESTRQVLDTYEAQVNHSLADINQAMDLVTFWRQRGGPGARLAELGQRELLPPDLLFTVSVMDAEGRIIDSTRSASIGSTGRAGTFEALRAGAKVAVSRPFIGPEGGDARLTFGRRLLTPRGEFNGAVTVDVDAEYFVSGYEEGVLGKYGLLALIGADGALRVQRIGDQVLAAGAVDYASLPHSGSDGATLVRVATDSSTDGATRWIAARDINAFPLTVIAGLSVAEQLGSLSERERGYYALAGIASLVSVLALSVLGRLSWQLSRSRERELKIRQEHAQRVEYLAYHDGLTGLANRSLFTKLLSQAVAEAVRYDQPVAILYLDLDHFKPINDSLGHDAGDELLKEIARRLQGCVRACDTVARLGGDEFVVLLPHAPTEAEIGAVAEKILEAAGRPMVLMDREVRVTASVGIALCPRDGRDEQTLLKNADAAMYRAKSEGKNNCQFYTDNLSSTSLERLSLEASLRHALERNELRLHYQARRDLATGRVNGMEALLRWEHPDLGIIPPMRFLPLADESGIIIPIGRWVLREACEQTLALRRKGLPTLCVAVNISTRQFYDERLLDDVRAALAHSGLEPWLLELELPESILNHSPEQTRRLLRALKEIGVRVAIGNFGMGYSTLRGLHNLSFDTIKMDRSLTRSITAAGQDPALADSLISVARRLSLTVVAQGVETSQQAEFLRQHACNELQGYYIGIPLPLDQFAAVLREQLPPGEPADHSSEELFRAG